MLEHDLKSPRKGLAVLIILILIIIGNIIKLITLKKAEEDEEKHGSIAGDFEEKEDDNQGDYHLHHNYQELGNKITL